MNRIYYGEDVPQIVKRRVSYLKSKYNLDNYDAFDASVRMGDFDKSKYAKLVNAWYFSDYREYIPKEYLPEYMDFEKYPLAYAEK